MKSDRRTFIKDFHKKSGIIQMTNQWPKTGRAGSPLPVNGAHGGTRPAHIAYEPDNPKKIIRNVLAVK